MWTPRQSGWIWRRSLVPKNIRIRRCRWNGVLRPEGQPAGEPFQEPPRVGDVEVDVVSEVGANVGVSVHQRAEEGRAADADHHGNQAQQQQDQAGVSARLIWGGESDRRHVASPSGHQEVAWAFLNVAV